MWHLCSIIYAMNPYETVRKSECAIASLIGNICLVALLSCILFPFWYLAYQETASSNAASTRLWLLSDNASANEQGAFLSDSEMSVLNLKRNTDRISLLFMGDMMFDRGVRTRIRSAGEEEVFASSTRNLTASYDLSIANLEGPITSSASKTIDSTGKAIPGFVFTFPTSTAALIKKSGIDIVSLANNHSDNFGPSGFRETTAWLEKSGVTFFGNGRNAATGDVPSAISTIQCIDSSIQTGSLKRHYCIGLIGYHGLVEQGEREIMSEIRRMSLAKVSAKEKAGVPDKEAARNSSSATSTLPTASVSPAPDFIIVFPHWGNEYQKTPSALQRRLAHEWIDAGADMVIGAHPHIVQPLETYKEKPIFYSLGNYIFDQYFSYDTTHGIALGLHLKHEDNASGDDKNPSALRLDEVTIIPLDLTGTVVRIAGPSDRTRMLGEIVKISSGLISTSTKDQVTTGTISF